MSVNPTTPEVVVPLPVIASVTRAAFMWTGPFGQSAVSVMHFSTDTADTAEIASAFSTRVQPDQFITISSAWEANTVVLTPLDGSAASSEWPLAGWEGGASAEFIPAGCAILKHTTLLRGRSYRGRTYLPGLGEESQAGGFLVGDTATAFTAVPNAWDEWREAMSSEDDVHLVIASYKLEVATDVQLTIGELAIGTQRRRQDRVRA